MKINSIIYTLLLMLVTSLLPIGCSDNEEVYTGLDKDKVHWTIGVTLPGAGNGETRAFGDSGTVHYTFKDLYVAVFAEVGGVSYLEEFVRADNTVPTWNKSNKCWDFGVSLSKTDGPRRLHLIANYPGLTMGFGEEGQLIGRLMANGANHDVYWNYRNVSKIAEDYELEVQQVPLVRNYVKIQLQDARKDTSNFKLTGYALYNVPTKGTVAPYNPEGSVMFADYVYNNYCRPYSSLLNDQGYKGNEPFDDGTLLSKTINWTTPTDGTFAPFYIYERNHSSTSSPTCMLIKGKYNGSSDDTFYKLDFVYEDATTHSNVYYNLLRNFVFTMKLNEVTGVGYNTVDEAIDAPASNNIGGDAVAEDYTNISDGTGRLFVSKTFMLFTRDEDAYLYYKYVPSLSSTTIDNNAVTITAPAGNVLQTAAAVSGADEASGIYQGWRKVTLNPKAVPAISQTQELIFAVNNTALQRKVKLLLSLPYTLNVAVADSVDRDKIVEKVQKSEITVDITLPAGLDVALFPLRMLISSKDNTIYAKPGKNMPAEVQNGKYGFIREISLEEYQDSVNRTFRSHFFTNCENSATIVYVDNEYFATGKDNFGNPGLNSVSLGTSVAVDVQQIYGRYPQKIYNGGSNNGTESVTATLNGNPVGTITIDRDNVTSGLTINDSKGLVQSDEVVFTFTDKYWHGGDNWSDITYTATATLSDIAAGKKLVFTAQGAINRTTSVAIPADIPVTVQQIWGRYPMAIYGTNGNNTGTESVTVSLNGNNLQEGKTITINSSKVTAGNTFSYPAGVGLDDELTFTFTDKHWVGGDNWTETGVEYVATSTLREISEGGALNFTVKGEIQKLKSITITTSQKVTVQQATVSYNYRNYSYYPKNIHNNNNSTTARNNGTESVTVTLNGVELTDEITIDPDNVTVGGQLEYDAGFSNDDVLIFTFSDNYAASRNNNRITWSNQPATYTATCTVEDLLNGTATLNFERQ